MSNNAIPPWVKVTLVTLVLLLFYNLYGNNHFYRDPNSIFYDSKRAYTRKYSLDREEEALKFLNKANHGLIENAKVLKDGAIFGATRPGRTYPLCAVVMTFGDKRGGSRHSLALTVASLLGGLTIPERRDLDMRVFIGNTDPTAHPLHGSPILSVVDYVTSAQEFANPNILSKLKYLEQHKTYTEKTAYDFSLAIEHCYLNSTAPYIALFEDDIVVAKGWFARTQLAIREAEAIATKKQQKWLDMRLFNDASEIRWTAGKYGINVPNCAIYNSLWLLFLAGSTYFLLTQLRKTTAGTKMLSEQAAKTISFFTVPIFFSAFVLSGYMSVMPRPDGVGIQQWGCCTQGEIFPRSQVPRLIAELRRRAKTTPADITLWLYAKEQRMLRVASDPPMLQHLGYSSTIVPIPNGQKMAWSVAFEDLKGDHLDQEHRRMVKELYG